MYPNTIMQIKALNTEEYINLVADDKKEGLIKLLDTIRKNIPDGFEECMSYGMIGFVVPHALYPAGYHCDPKTPLPFVSIAAQKNFIAIYHMGIYATPKLHDWFVAEHAKASPKKLDMGKSCIRYKKAEDIPYELIGELFTKMSVDDWINGYTSAFLKPKK